MFPDEFSELINTIYFAMRPRAAFQLTTVSIKAQITMLDDDVGRRFLTKFLIGGGKLRHDQHGQSKNRL